MAFVGQDDAKTGAPIDVDRIAAARLAALRIEYVCVRA